MSKLNKFFYDFLGMENKKLDEITLSNLEGKMEEKNFPKKLIEELLVEFNKVINERGESGFQEWIDKLHYQVPDPFGSESKAEEIYKDYGRWVEKEVIDLERETELSWEKQTEDIKGLDMKARKAQLVLRHRISDIVLELLS